MKWVHWHVIKALSLKTHVLLGDCDIQICRAQICKDGKYQVPQEIIEKMVKWVTPFHVCWVASVESESLWPYGLLPTMLLSPWDSPGKNTGVTCLALLQVIFLTQGSNLRLLHCGQMFHSWAMGDAWVTPTCTYPSPANTIYSSYQEHRIYWFNTHKASWSTVPYPSSDLPPQGNFYWAIHR